MKQFSTFFKALALTLAVAGIYVTDNASACTGISFTAADGSQTMARSIEWAKGRLESHYVVVPRGHKFQSLTPEGKNGLTDDAKYGFVGVRVTFDDLIVEGLNEKGLSAGLFFFPDFGSYAEFDNTQLQKTLCDFQLVSWTLANFETVDQFLEQFSKITITGLDPRAGAVHWRVADCSGRQIVVEIIGGQAHVYDYPVGVLTNAPDFQWHLTNLGNYVNLLPGSGESKAFASVSDKIQVKPLSGGSGMLGLPGDPSSPSRFVRIAVYKATAPVPADAYAAMLQSFKILESLVIPIGAVVDVNTGNPDALITSTQFTTASDMQGRKFYFRTMDNSRIRCLDLNKIDFDKVKYRSVALDEKPEQIEVLKIK